MPGTTGSGAGFFEKCRDFRFDFREVIDDDIPDNLPVYLEIPVDYVVSHAGNLPPFNIRMFLFELGGQVFYRFTDDLDRPYDCVCVIFVSQEIVITPAGANLPEKHDLPVDMG